MIKVPAIKLILITIMIKLIMTQITTIMIIVIIITSAEVIISFSPLIIFQNIYSVCHPNSFSAQKCNRIQLAIRHKGMHRVC